MKMLVIRNKKTGKLLTVSGDDVFWADSEAICWPGSLRDSVENALKPGDEIVSLREEPTEPCEWCGDITTEGKISRLTDEIIEEEGIVTLLQTTEKTLPMFEWKFCPNCGRRLE